MSAYETVWTNDPRRASECCNAPLIDEWNMCSHCKEYAMSIAAKAEFERQHELWKIARAATGTRVVEDEDECPHDETDHHICLDCGKDCLDDAIARADLLEDR